MPNSIEQISEQNEAQADESSVQNVSRRSEPRRHIPIESNVKQAPRRSGFNVRHVPPRSETKHIVPVEAGRIIDQAHGLLETAARLASGRLTDRQLRAAIIMKEIRSKSPQWSELTFDNIEILSDNDLFELRDVLAIRRARLAGRLALANEKDLDGKLQITLTYVVETEKRVKSVMRRRNLLPSENTPNPQSRRTVQRVLGAVVQALREELEEEDVEAILARADQIFSGMMGCEARISNWLDVKTEKQPVSAADY